MTLAQLNESVIDRWERKSDSTASYYDFNFRLSNAHGELRERHRSYYIRGKQLIIRAESYRNPRSQKHPPYHYVGFGLANLSTFDPYSKTEIGRRKCFENSFFGMDKVQPSREVFVGKVEFSEASENQFVFKYPPINETEEFRSALEFCNKLRYAIFLANQG